MARASVNRPPGPPPSSAPTRRRPPPPKRRKNWIPAVVIIVLAVIVIAAVAVFVLTRSDDSEAPETAFADACAVVDAVEIGEAIGYPVGTGVPAAAVAPLSGCAFAPADPSDPAVGVIITTAATDQDTFDRELLASSYSTVESVRGLGQDAFYVSRDTNEEGGTELLLVVTDGDKGVEVAINGNVSVQEAYGLARPVAELYTSELGLD